MSFEKDFREYWEEDLNLVALAQGLNGDFESLPFSCKWGVYLEFFDSKEISISIAPRELTDGKLSYIGQVFLKYPVRLGAENAFIWDEPEDQIETKTRQEAQKQAIETAKKLYQ